MDPLHYEVTDDSGFIGIADPDAYRLSLDLDLPLDKVGDGFKQENARLRLIFWGTGREDVWRVRVTFTPYVGETFREFESLIRSSRGRLQLVSYDDVSMAAEYPAHALTSPTYDEWRVDVPLGLYRCRVIQRFDPEPYDPELRDEDADFVIELTPVNAPATEQVGRLYWAREFETPETPVAPKVQTPQPVGRLQSFFDKFRKG